MLGHGQSDIYSWIFKYSLVCNLIASLSIWRQENIFLSLHKSPSSRSIRENKAVGWKGEKDGEKEKDNGQDGESEPILQRILCVPCRARTAEGRWSHTIHRLSLGYCLIIYIYYSCFSMKAGSKIKKENSILFQFSKIYRLYRYIHIYMYISIYRQLERLYRLYIHGNSMTTFN